ncbi:MAG: Rhamnosyl O-methyltransferase [Desulfovibrio sp.]
MGGYSNKGKTFVMKTPSFPELETYKAESLTRVAEYHADKDLQNMGHDFLQTAINKQYAYNFFWCGVPLLQIPQETQAMQEVIWEVKPDCIIETGVAWGGSLMFSASMLCVLESCNYITNGLVIGIDIEIRPHNKQNIQAHPLASKIHLLEGSSIDENIVAQVSRLVEDKKRILVCLDSNHTHAHVLQELRLYSPFVGIGSYCIVGDTGIEDFENAPHTERPWGAGNSPKSAVHAFLKESSDFIVDSHTERKLIFTGSPDGYLKRIKK